MFFYSLQIKGSKVDFNTIITDDMIEDEVEKLKKTSEPYDLLCGNYPMFKNFPPGTLYLDLGCELYGQVDVMASTNLVKASYAKEVLRNLGAVNIVMI